MGEIRCLFTICSLGLTIFDKDGYLIYKIYGK